MEINDLIKKGYFPEEILPPFTSDDLLIVVDEVILNLDAFDPVEKRKKKLITKLLPFSTPKIKGYRRNLAIPHPLHYIRLSNTIVNDWISIVDHCNKSKISVSKLRVKKDTLRALVKPSFDLYIKERIIRSTGYRFLLRIDISRCYNSIYTHSIPWALHTKVISKAKRDRLALLGNALDEDSRKIQDGQTVGIPIGPDSSRIVSEIILSAIDVELDSVLKYLTGIRIIDDYFLYFKNLGDLEIARAVIQRTLKEFELELNQSKERIVELPEVIESEWFNNLREFRFRNDWRAQRKDIISFFDKTFSYAKNFPDDLVLTYAMSKLRATIFHIKNWSILQSLLLNSLIIEPKILPYIAQTLISYDSKGYPLNETIINSALEEFILFHLSLNNDFEVSWGLWILKSLSITISENVATQLSKTNNSVVVLVVLDLQQSGLIPAGLDTSEWESLLSAESLYSENWLLAYEAKQKGWLTTPVDYISKDPFFKMLKDNDVQFYKPERQLDLTKVRVTSASLSIGEFISDDEAEAEEEEPESVFEAISPVKARSPFSDEGEDLPFI
ncbi:RNA-directed DNA polymerase [Daejeonella sp. JGW-45]|uniref:RNA-directed DNA polymerase n=1 Tax=Daejeonella sp. JGW-45 TaxID=3034148 RepID=UPI0023EDB9FF|nr:RNA-directed DNA polymerase [Daejeonella sp. JGW-45]